MVFIITGFAMNGYADEASKCFDKMIGHGLKTYSFWFVAQKGAQVF